MADDMRHEFDVGSADEMQRKYGWYAENRPVIHVEAADVPPQLRDLIPFVERWAIPCDITRQDYLDKQREVDVREFARLVGRRKKEVDAWLASIQGQLPEAGCQFMYLLKAWCEAACAFPDEVA